MFLIQKNFVFYLILPLEKNQDTYYHINLGYEDKSIPPETDSRWHKETRPTAIEAIKNKIFSADTTTTTGTGTAPENTTDLSSKEQEIWNTTLINANAVTNVTSDTKWNNFPCVPVSYNKNNGDSARVNVENQWKNVIFIIDGDQYLSDGTYCKDNKVYYCEDTSKKFTCNQSSIKKS